MAFRDDRDALLARAAALEREAERLRRDNEALRTAAEQRAAADAEEARHRDVTEAQAAARRAPLEGLAARPPAPTAAPRLPRPSRRRGRAPRSETDRRIDRALAGSRWITVLLWLCAPLIVVVPIVLLLTVGPRVREHPVVMLVLYGSLLAPALGIAGVVHVANRIDARRQRRWLANLGLPLDVPRYLAVLSIEDHRKVARIRVELEVPPGPDDRRLLAAAAQQGLPGTSARWDGDVLVIASPVLATSSSHKGRTRYDNAPVHRWFREVARRLLGPIAAAVPVARVTVT